MRMRVVVFAAAAVLSAAAFGNAPSFGAAAPAGDPVKGKAHFDRVGCWQCHGREGQGGREGPRIAAPVPAPTPTAPSHSPSLVVETAPVSVPVAVPSALPPLPAGAADAPAAASPPVTPDNSGLYPQ